MENLVLLIPSHVMRYSFCIMYLTQSSQAQQNCQPLLMAAMHIQSLSGTQPPPDNNPRNTRSQANCRRRPHCARLSAHVWTDIPCTQKRKSPKYSEAPKL